MNSLSLYIFFKINSFLFLDRYELMRLCWHEKPAERPSFTFIHEQLEQMMLRHCSYLDLSNANQYCHAQCCDTDSDDEENTAF